mgnify:CR=1 FL=1
MLKLKCNTTNVRAEIAAVVAAALNKSYYMSDVKCIVRHNSIEFSSRHSSWTVDIEYDSQTNKYEVCWFENNVSDTTAVMESPELVVMSVLDTFF